MSSKLLALRNILKRKNKFGRPYNFKRLDINNALEPTLLSEQILRCRILPSHIKICCSTYNVPNAQTLQTFRKEKRWGPRTPPAANRTPVLTPRNFSSRRTSGPRWCLGPPPAPGPAAPAGTSADPPDGPRARGRRRLCSTGGRGSLPAPAGQRQRGERPGSGPGAPRFSQTPTWRRPPPATTTPPRAADGPETAEASAGKFRFSSPGPPGTGAQPTSGFTYPAGRGRRRRQRRSDSSSSRAPGADSARSSAPVSQGVCSQRPRAGGAIRTRRAGGRPAQPLAGDSPAPPVEPHNGRRGWPLPCACTGAPPPTRQARALGHEHTHTTHSPALSCLFPRPARAARATCSRGRGLCSGHTHLGSPRQRVRSSALCAVSLSRAPRMHVGRLTWFAWLWHSFGKDCSSLYEVLGKKGRKAGFPFPYHERASPGNLRTFCRRERKAL